MESASAHPFSDDGWELDRGNSYVRDILTERRDAYAKVGTIGRLSQRIEDEFLFWQLVVSLRLPPDELDKWTLGDMRSAAAVMDMRNDYSLAYQKMMETK